MGDLRPGNGGSWPPDDGGAPRDGLPDLPPEWGTVVIPDDPAELAEEAARVRRQLRRSSRRDGVRRLLAIGPASRRHTEGPSLLAPLLIMAIAIATTLVSLFAVTWNRSQPAPDNAIPARSATPLADLTFIDASGQKLRIGTVLPAVIILTDSCACVDLITTTAGAVPADTTVIAVSTTGTTIPDAPANVQSIADPRALIRTWYAANVTPVPDRATVLLIDEANTVTTIPAAATVDEIVPGASVSPSPDRSKPGTSASPRPSASPTA